MTTGRNVEEGLPSGRNGRERPFLKWAAFLVIGVLALAIRVPRLADRPMHTDEAVQAYLVGEILAGKGYHYSKVDLHGPAPLAVALPIVRLCGANDLASLDASMLRVAPALTGALVVLLFALLNRGVGTLAAATAALLWSTASLPVYYSRYFIHETLFVGATFGLMICSWRALVRGSNRWGIVAGVCAGVMLGCKETAVISIASMAVAGLPWVIRRIDLRRRVGVIGLALIVCVVVFLAFYTWGGSNWRGPLDFIGSFGRFARRATGEGHEKPAWYYLGLLGDYPAGFAVLALALAGVVDGIRRRVWMARYFAIYGFLIFVIYSAIPYKTPWLALNFWLPISILAGCGFAAIWRVSKPISARAAVIAVFMIILAVIGHDTWGRVFLKPYDERNPYAYAHTGEDLRLLPERVQRWAREREVGDELRIAVVAADAWPLPWYLRRFQKTGYWQPEQDPGPADLYITLPEAGASLGSRIQGWRPEFFGVRPGVLAILWTPPEKETILQSPPPRQ
ncbi:MAG: flippase activity-associated protein Agl23 [Verrucomicrobiae bacterium]